MTEVPKSGSMKTSAKSTPTIARGLKGSPEPEGSRATAQLSRQHGGELGELRGLHGHETEVEPPPRAVDPAPDPRDEDEYEPDQDDYVQGRGVLAPRRVPDTARHEEDGHPEYHVHDALEQGTVSRSRRVDHDEPQQREAKRHEEQVCPEATHRPTVLSASQRDLTREPGERVAPLGIARELVEARAPRREQDDVARPLPAPRPSERPLRGRRPCGPRLPNPRLRGTPRCAGRPRPGTRPPCTRADGQQLREVRTLLRPAEDEHHGHLEALQGGSDRGGVRRLRVVHVGDARGLFATTCMRCGMGS